MLKELIGKLSKLFRKRKKYVGLRPETHLNPTYPPDLNELFGENRLETHTDNCLWQKYETDNS